jgi:hypothetical protein
MYHFGVFAVLLILVPGIGNAQHPRDSMLGCSCNETAPCEPCGEIFCNPCDEIDCGNVFGKTHCGKKSLWDSVNTFGWLQAGLYVNSHGHKNVYVPPDQTGPATRNFDPLSGNTYMAGTTQPANLMLNQLWLGAEKTLDTKRGWDWGFRGDFMFGTDARFPQCFGDQSFDYGWGSGDYYDAVVQLYAEAGYKNLKFRVGKFATIMFYEPVPGPLSFFYSHAYLCYSGPMTQTGAVAEYKINYQWTVLGGWTAGYHNSFENRFGDNGFLGQVQYRPNNGTAFIYSLYYGDHNGLYKRADAVNYGRAYGTESEIIMTLHYTWQINKRWFYMIEGLWEQADDEGGQTGDLSRKSYGLNQHLTYTINKKWSVGTRFEWMNGKGTFIDLAPFTGGQGTNIYDITVAANWNMTDHITIRPELRYDWTFYHNGFKPFGGGIDKDQLSGGVALIVIF